MLPVLMEAHLHGVLHRDLKPSNILLNEEDEPFVADFGLARLDSITSGDGLPSLTMSGEFVGSLAWASPEQLSGDGSRVDVRSDVYAIGVMLHQVMTRGGTPFGSSDDVRALMRRVLNEPPTFARRQAPDMPRDLETIILNCLHREPERRYQSAGELARDLSRWLAGEPIEARRQSAAVSLRQWVTRHRASARQSSRHAVRAKPMRVSVAERGQQIKDLRPDRNIQCRNGLVKQNKIGVDDQRAGDCYALALPAREFVDVFSGIFGA